MRFEIENFKSLLILVLKNDLELIDMTSGVRPVKNNSNILPGSKLFFEKSKIVFVFKRY